MQLSGTRVIPEVRFVGARVPSLVTHDAVAAVGIGTRGKRDERTLVTVTGGRQ